MTDNQTANLKISLITHSSLKKLCDQNGWFMGGFADRAIMKEIDRIAKQKEKSKIKQ